MQDFRPSRTVENSGTGTTGHTPQRVTRAAAFDIDPLYLATLLHMPTTATIMSVQSYTNTFGNLLIRVTAHDATLPEAAQPHDASPIVTKEAVRWDWGIPS